MSVQSLTTTSTGITVQSGNVLAVESGGVAIDTTILTGGYAEVDSGGTTSDTHISFAGLETVESGGTASATSISLGGELLVFSGGSASSTVVSYGGELALSGGTAAGTVVSNGGEVDVGFGGVASGTTILSGGELNVSLGGLAQGTVISNGGEEFIDHGGLAQGAIVSSGGYEAITNGALASGTTVLSGGEEFVAGLASGTIISNGGIQFVAQGGNATGSIILSGGTLVETTPGTVSDVQINLGGRIEVGGTLFSASDHVSYDSSTHLLTVTSGTTQIFSAELSGDYTAADFQLGTASDGHLLVTYDTAPCYCLGTLISTDKGLVPVEDLSIGDRVLTHAGEMRAIKWIGRRGYDGRFIHGNADILPVCIKGGALGCDTPSRDLWVSPHHALYLDGLLIEARDLVNGLSIVQANDVGRVDYFHIEIDSHDVICAEGAWAESYLDDDSRNMFSNAREFASLYPDEAGHLMRYYAPRRDAGAELEQIRQRLDARAALEFGVKLKEIA